MACDEPARTRHPALGAAAVERTRARRRRGGRLSKPSVFVEAPHLVVERTRRGVAATLHGVPRRQHGVRRRCGRHDGPFGARSFHQHVAAHAPGRVRLGDGATFFAGPPNKLWTRRAALKRTSRPRATGAASRRPSHVEEPAERRPNALQMKPVLDRTRQTHAIDATSCRSASSRWSGRWNTWARVVAVAVDR